MPIRTVAHSVIRWTDIDGVRRESLFGDVVDFPDAVVEKFERHGAFAPDVDDVVEPEDVVLSGALAERLGLPADADQASILAALDDALAVDPAAEPVVPEPVSETQPVATTVEPAPAPKSDPAKPKPTDLVKVWEDYAVEKGFDRKEAEKMSKTDLIAALS
ncbi:MULTISPECIES: hypothetical protein [unclassified Rhodococcus (in: high G+C Gram-positive bacteria)]|uniref:hypothetical protein n=1 Tax=unclassified Rhodococcus (in: high G+C Gram-positive bacteria) TaxID=192944 RepID=UPI000B9C498C|nr:MULTISPECIES: hypothetical protein [unclassified Rhodococcus (in: high G+C Gram-positive bacteria)]OZE35609.1 hypothetical protein CH259_16405 [Rhodococcus sp. 05-2254-4]OZE48038.1 hypothetical protein CH261_09000 [Rhodococcus sp. 05-2254-3]OZE49249.1 hypothetical protein CH283_16785 [Rhodococcus sp. 05-2254-2]